MCKETENLRGYIKSLSIAYTFQVESTQVQERFVNHWNTVKLNFKKY